MATGSCQTKPIRSGRPELIAAEISALPPMSIRSFLQQIPESPQRTDPRARRIIGARLLDCRYRFAGSDTISPCSAACAQIRRVCRSCDYRGIGIWIHQLNLAGSIGSLGHSYPFQTGDIFSSARPCLIINRNATAVIETHNLIATRTTPRQRIERHFRLLQRHHARREALTIEETTNCKPKRPSANTHQYNELRLHATLVQPTPATWHRGQLEEVGDERAWRMIAAHAQR